MCVDVLSGVGMQWNAEDFAFFSDNLVNGVSVHEDMCTYGQNIVCVYVHVYIFGFVYFFLHSKCWWLSLSSLYLVWLLFSTAWFLKSLLWISRYWPHTSTILVTETQKYFWTRDQKNVKTYMAAYLWIKWKNGKWISQHGYTNYCVLVTLNIFVGYVK